MPKEIAISVDDVSKNFRLPHERADSVKSLFINPFRKVRNNIEVQHALKGISFTVNKGEFFGVVGRNGSGKSTLLKVIAGIYQPTKGSVSVNGRLVPFIELGVGFNPELTGRENVYLNGALLGFSTKEIDRKYKAIVEFSELERFMDQRLKNYSSGMQVRLAFSVATILAESDILLIDEVLAVGDTDFQRKCFEYFRRLKKEKKTVIFVSHDMDAVRSYCDRAVLLDSNEVVARGSANKVAEKYSHLFLDKIEVSKNTEKQERWGNGDAKFHSPKCSPRKLARETNEITISAKLSIKKDMDEVVVGFAIKNQAETLLMGNNNRLMEKRLKEVKAGSDVSVEWKVPNIFNDGEYSINLTAESDTTDPCDWWQDAIQFSVRKDSGTGFLVSPDMKLKIKKNENGQS